MKTSALLSRRKAMTFGCVTWLIFASVASKPLRRTTIRLWYLLRSRIIWIYQSTHRIFKFVIATLIMFSCILSSPNTTAKSLLDSGAPNHNSEILLSLKRNVQITEAWTNTKQPTFQSSQDLASRDSDSMQIRYWFVQQVNWAYSVNSMWSLLLLQSSFLGSTENMTF